MHTSWKIVLHLLPLLTSAIPLSISGFPSSGGSWNHTTGLTVDFPDPNIDPFYQAPSWIDLAAPGQILRSRQVVTTVTGSLSETYQLLYRTTNQQGGAVGTLATVWTPALPAYPPKVFSYAQPEDALNLACSPSWAWVNTSSPQESYFRQISFVIPWALKQGYYVVVSDNEGPDSAWLVGNIEGNAALDGVRATLNLIRVPPSIAQVAFFGYSGGAHTSLWASTVAEQYAPELNIVGAAFGGTVVDLGSTYQLLNKSPGAALAGSLVLGLANGYPELNASLSAQFTPDGTAVARDLRASNHCTTTVTAEYANDDFNAFFQTPLFDIPAVQAVFRNESLLTNVSGLAIPVPKFPRFQWHGAADTTVPYASEAVYVQQQCDAGADIRFVTFPDSNHGTTLIQGIPGALDFIQRAFAGATTSVACGSNVTVPAPGSTAAIELLGLEYDVFLLASIKFLAGS